MQKKICINSIFLVHGVVIILIFVLCCLNIRKLDYIAVLNDEFGYWSNAVSWAGYDWKELIAETPYYAWGYSIWLIPIIICLRTPEVWYKTAIFFNVFLLIISYFFCCGVAKRLFSKINKNIIYIVSFLVTIYPSNIVYAQVAWSETLLYCLMWAATYLMIKLDEKFSYFKAVLLTLVLLYMYMVHARSIGIVGVGLLCILMMILKNRKSVFSFLCLLAIVALGYIINNYIKGYQLSEFWNNSLVSNMNNVGLNTNTVSAYWEKFVGNFNLLLESLGGKLVYLIVATGLTIVVEVVQFIKEEIEAYRTRSFSTNYNITKVWSNLAFLASWGLCALQMLTWTDRKDIIVYSRYMENAIGPILLLGIIYAITCIKETRVALVISAIALLLGLRSVYWRILEAGGSFNSICSPILGTFYDFFEGDAYKAFCCIGIICFSFFLLFVITTFFKRDYLKYGIVLICLFGYFIFLIKNGSIYMNEARDYFDSSTIPIKEIITEKYNTQEIYYIKNDKDTYSVKPKYLQFTIPDKSIHLTNLENVEDISDEYILLVDLSDNTSIETLEKDENVQLILTTNQLNVYEIAKE